MHVPQILYLFNNKLWQSFKMAILYYGMHFNHSPAHGHLGGLMVYFLKCPFPLCTRATTPDQNDAQFFLFICKGMNMFLH